MNTNLKDYFKTNGYCTARGEHELEVMQWPFAICKHCNEEFMLLTRDMVDSIFEVKFFEERLSS